jgi:hypothetical protein
MRTSFRRLTVAALSLTVAAGGTLLPGPLPAVALQGDKRPNLQMLQLRDWRVQTSGGRRLLRFTTIFVNAGRGPFELRGTRDSTTDATMDMDQIMFRYDGSRRRIDTPAIARYSGDGHNHWHVQGVVTYEAWKLTDPARTRRGAKTGFCFLDTTAWKLSLRNARQRSYYQEEWCGSRSVLSNRVGVSVGWGDRYPWSFAHQWIDITGLPGGIYRVRATVDIQDFYDEQVETDNCTWTKIRIPSPGSSRPPVVYANGRDCGKDAITPVTTFAGGEAWDPARAVSLSAGVHLGFTFNSQGTMLRRLWRNLRAPRTGTASARAIPPGQSGGWLYMVTGPYAGYWLKEGAGVQVQP